MRAQTRRLLNRVIVAPIQSRAHARPGAANPVARSRRDSLVRLFRPADQIRDFFQDLVRTAIVGGGNLRVDLPPRAVVRYVSTAAAMNANLPIRRDSGLASIRRKRSVPKQIRTRLVDMSG